MNKKEIIFIKNRRKENLNFDKLKKLAGKFLVWDSSLEFFEMYPFQNEKGMIFSKPTDQQYLKNKFINTRTKIKTETRLEIDKLSQEKAETILIQTGLNLQKEEYHFAIFSCEGGRSPHLVVYDLSELENMTPFKRFMAQVIFWRKHMPFGTLQYADTGIFHDDHFVPLEFSNHWRHGTPFELLLEYNPRPHKTWEEKFEERKVRAKIYKEAHCKKCNQ